MNVRKNIPLIWALFTRNVKVLDSAVQLNLFKVTTTQGQQIGIQKFRIGSGEG